MLGVKVCGMFFFGIWKQVQGWAIPVRTAKLIPHRRNSKHFISKKAKKGHKERECGSKEDTTVAPRRFRFFMAFLSRFPPTFSSLAIRLDTQPEKVAQ